MQTISDLNSKIWYRFLKVFYLFVFTVFALVLPIVAFVATGQPEYDISRSYIKCADGKNFILDKNGFSRLSLDSSYLDSWDEGRAKYLCFDGTFSSGLKTLEDTKYELVTFQKERNYFLSTGLALLTLLGVILGFELTKRIFYYIVLGKFTPADIREDYLKKTLSIFNREKDSKVPKEATRAAEGMGGKAIRGARLVLELFLALMCFSLFFKAIVFITPIIAVLIINAANIDISGSERVLRNIDAASNILAFVASIIITKKIFTRLT